MSKIIGSFVTLCGRPFTSVPGLAQGPLMQLCQKKCSNGVILSPAFRLTATRTHATFNADSSRFSDHPNSARKGKKSIWPRIKAFTTFTMSGVLVIGAAGLSIVVIYLIGSELFSPSGDTRLFNRSVSMIEKDEIARTLLQCEDREETKERLKAYGETFSNDKWTRNRPISSSKQIDRNGKAHYYMRFHVESKKKRGLVHIEAVESEQHYQPDFTSMYIDISGEKRHYLIKPKLHKAIKPNGFLGVNWGPKRD